MITFRHGTTEVIYDMDENGFSRYTIIHIGSMGNSIDFVKENSFKALGIDFWNNYEKVYEEGSPDYYYKVIFQL